MTELTLPCKVPGCKGHTSRCPNQYEARAEAERMVAECMAQYAKQTAEADTHPIPQMEKVQ